MSAATIRNSFDQEPSNAEFGLSKRRRSSPSSAATSHSSSDWLARVAVMGNGGYSCRGAPMSAPASRTKRIRHPCRAEAYRFPQQHEFPNTLMQDRKFHHFIIITIIMPLEHDSIICRENALGGPLARRFTRPRRVRPCRVHRRCSRSSIPDALGDYPASAKAGGCIGCRIARPLGKAAASELAWLQGARTSARSATADRGAEISYVERRRTSRPLAHRTRACPGRGDAYRTYSGAD